MVTDCCTLFALASGARPFTSVDHLDVRIEVGLGDHLTDFGIGIAAGASGRKATEERTTARTPAKVSLLGVTLLQRDLFGGTHIGQGQHYIGCLALETDAANHGTRDTTHHATEQATDVLAPGLGVWLTRSGTST